METTKTVEKKLVQAGMSQDDEGNTSSMRIATLFGIASIMGVWVITCLRLEAFIDIPEGVCWALGIFIFGKASQKGVEVFKTIKR